MESNNQKRRNASPRTDGRTNAGDRHGASPRTDGRANVSVRRGASASHYRPARDASGATGDRSRRNAPSNTPGHNSGSRRTESMSGRNAAAHPTRRASSQNRSQSRRSSPSGGAVVRRGTYAVTEKKSVVRRAADFTEKQLERRRNWIIKGNDQRLLTEKRRNAGIVRTRSGVDRPMLVLMLVLLALGSIAVFSASYPAAIAEGLNAMYYVKKQLIFIVLGGIAMVVTTAIPYTFYKRIAPLAFGLVTLLLCAVPFVGIRYQGTRRWIGIPGTDFTIQPSELMKIAVVLILAWYCDKFREKVTDRLSFKNTFFFGVVFPALFVGVACGLVIIEKHLSATAIIAAIGLSVMVIGGSHIGITLGGAAATGFAAFKIYIAKNPYAANRVNTMLDENANVLAEKWQTTQGLLAIGSGGLLGVGLGSGRLKFSYVSEAQNDFIFTIWCEETGFVGAVLVILLYLAFVWRGFKIAMHAPDTFSALVVYGLSAHVGIQAFLNILVVTDNMFNTGVSLPFFSYGGSSLVVLLAEMGIILSISKHSFQKR